MIEMAHFVKPIMNMTPPDPASLNPKGLKDLHFLGKRFKKLSAEDKHNQVQLMTMSAVDFLDQWFETDVLKATMSASGIIGTFLGVRSPGTAYVLLHHYMGEIDGAFRSWGLSRGGTGAISNAIADAGREAGVEIRTEAPIAKIILKNGAAKGVILQNGDELYADVVSSSVDPRLTFMKMVGAEHLPDDFTDDLKRYKYRGSSGKVNLALDGLPDFKCLPGAGPHLRGAVSISPSVEYMERAYDEAKYGRFSRRPYIDMVIPSLTDTSVAPPGKHVMSCFVQYAPYNLKEGNWDDKREEFGDTVIDTIAEHAPNIKDLILHRQVLTPLDLERDFGLSEGNIFQGELTLEQLFFLRPAPGWAQYRTPIRESLHVRIGHASGRRHYGRAGAQCGDANAERSKVAVGVLGKRGRESKTDMASRLCRLPCGKALPYRELLFEIEAAPPRHSLKVRNELPERQSLSARVAAKPPGTDWGIAANLEARVKGHEACSLKSSPNEAIRHHHYRRGPQRPGGCLLSSKGGTENARARPSRNSWRRINYRRIPSRLSLFHPGRQSRPTAAANH